MRDGDLPGRQIAGTCTIALRFGSLPAGHWTLHMPRAKVSVLDGSPIGPRIAPARIKIMKQLATLLACMAALIWAAHASAALPENGLYTVPGHAGLGVYIEVQGQTVVAMIYTHEKDSDGPTTGDPTYLISSGALVVTDDQAPQTYLFSAKMYSFDGGPCLTCAVREWEASAHALPAGTLSMYFRHHDAVQATVEMNDGSSRSLRLSRFRFGHTSYSVYLPGWDTLWVSTYPDMRGIWTMVDRSGDEPVVLNYHFTEVTGPERFEGTLFGTDYGEDGRSIESVSFRDPSRDATLICIPGSCTLKVAGTDVYWFKAGRKELMLGSDARSGGDIAMGSMLGRSGPDAEKTIVTAVRIPNFAPDIQPPATAGAEKAHTPGS